MSDNKPVQLGLCCLNTVLRGQKPTVFCSRKMIIRSVKEKGINGGNANNRWRFVPHYGLSKKDIDYVAKTMNELINNI